MALFPITPTGAEFSSMETILSPLHEAPNGIGEQVVNMSTTGPGANAFTPTDDPQYILMAPFFAQTPFTVTAFCFESGVATSSYNVTNFLCDQNGILVARTPYVFSVSVGVNRITPSTTMSVLPPGVYYLGNYFTESITSITVYSYWGTKGAVKVPNLRAMGCLALSVVSGLDATVRASAVGTALSLIPVPDTVASNVINAWITCTTNI